MRVLITGGAGFIGSHLVDHYIGAGHKVVVVDDFSTGNADNLAHHSRTDLTIVEGKAEDRLLLERAILDVDLIYHLAAVVGVFEVLRRPLDALRSSLASSDVVFEIAARRGVRTIFTSTSEVYGKNNKVGLRETDDCVFGPTSVTRWLYAVAKAADEFMALAYAREKDFPVTIVRLFNTIGPRQTGAYGMVVPRFVRQALANEPLTIYGDGSQTRCFTNVHDVVKALTMLASTPRSVGQVVNIGQPHEIAIRNLAELVRDLCGSASPVAYVPYEAAYGEGFEDMHRRIPDVTRLSGLIGTVPATTLDETIAQIIVWERRGRPEFRGN